MLKNGFTTCSKVARSFTLSSKNAARQETRTDDRSPLLLVDDADLFAAARRSAPGSDMLASYSEAAPPGSDPNDPTRVPFNILSGTSMSCRHVAGLVGLLKTLHPHWTPAAIRSAIMSTGMHG